MSLPADLPAADRKDDRAAALELQFFAPAFKHDVKISGPGDSQDKSHVRYFASVSSFRTYHVILHRGADTHGPELAAVYMRGGGTFHLCMGDPYSADAVWVDMRNKTPLKMPTYELIVPSKVKGAEDTDERRLTFRRTSKTEDGITGLRKVLPNWRVEDTSTGDVMATFLADWHRNGRLIFRQEVSDELEVWITLALVSLWVKHYRGGGG
jgi:hypothetical protein